MRAAPSFQSGSRPIISSNASAAASRSPAAASLRPARTAPRDRQDWPRSALRAHGVGGGRGGRQIQGRLARDTAGLLGALGRQRRKDGSRFFHLPRRDEGSRQRPGDAEVVGRHLADLAEDRRRPGGVAFGQDLLAHRHQRLDVGLRRRAAPSPILQLGQQLVEHALELGLGAIAGDVGDRLPLVEGIDRRHRLDAELRGDQFVLGDVDGDQLDALGRIVGGDLVEHRRAACMARTIAQNSRMTSAAIDGWMTSRSSRSIASRSASLRPRVATLIRSRCFAV